ncbi:MAG: DUF429 domain-containing protein [Cyanobacteria bacterium P01_G01_bin.49]
MKFIGIDLGWTSGFSGLCCLSLDHNKLTLLDLTRIQPTDEILQWLDTWVKRDESALVAVDAPTIIPNLTGTRLPDKLTHRFFGRYHGGCYPANLQRPFADRTVGFGISLKEKGFIHSPTIDPKKLGRYQIEVYPHPAIVHLFKLKRILKYKKGKLADRTLELMKLQDYIIDFLPSYEPHLTLSSSDLKRLKQLSLSSKITGNALKSIEDQLDSLICAYIGAYWWYWGVEKNLVLGNIETGYIIVPSPIVDVR